MGTPVSTVAGSAPTTKPTDKPTDDMDQENLPNTRYANEVKGMGLTRRIVVALGAISLAMVPAARAQPAGAAAETMFREAKALMAAGKIAEACAAFDASQKLDPTNSTLLNQANCREKNGQLATAWGIFLAAERETRTARDESMQKLHQLALDRANKLELRISKLTINVPDASRIDRLEIRRGNDLIDAAVWNRAIPVDGGIYKITAHAPGTTEWSSTVTVATEGDTKTVDIPKLQSPAPIPTTPPKPARGEPAGAPAGHRSKLVPLAVGTIGLVAVGGALGFKLWGDSRYDEAKAETMDNARRHSLEDSANNKRYVAEGLAIAGIGCAGLAVWLYVRAGHETAKALSSEAVSTRWWVEPMIASERAGIQVWGRF